MVRGAARAGRPPRRALVRRRRLPARGGAAAGGARVADGLEPPATQVALDVPAVAEFAEGGARLWAEGPRDDPEAFLRMFLDGGRLRLRPALPAPAGARAGARLLMTERGPWEAEIPLDDARGDAIPEARRLRRPPPGLRRDLRPAGARAGSRARRLPRLRPRSPAPPGLQRDARGLRRACCEALGIDP